MYTYMYVYRYAKINMVVSHIHTYVHMNIYINEPMMVKKNKIVHILGPGHIFAMHYYNTL